MTTAEIAAARPEPLPAPGADRIADARARMEATGQWHDRQNMGRRWGIGCVALEITQRCNLDCTLCYLSDHSEAVKDIPLEEVFRRIDAIRAHYGPDTDIQITGGDPTLRDRAELVAIVRYARAAGLSPSLFTNGIRATRDMLEELAANGLVDVAFHVDMTQERKGYPDEASLNAVRREYIDRARGLPISVFFNTTVYDGNFAQIPGVAEFFVQHADVVRLASFQLQADTGRGTVRARQQPITIDTVAGQLRAGARAPINFDTPIAGHDECNRYALTVVADGHVHDLMDDPKVLATAFEVMHDAKFDRRHRAKTVATLIGRYLARPRALARTLPWAARKLLGMSGDLWRAGGRANKLTFFLHNFMDAENLCRQRIGACVFMVQTAEGPISMCLHNAKRDSFILQPLRVGAGEAAQWWDPLSGGLRDKAEETSAPTLTKKTARGRRRLEINHGASR
ncbi:radical SAM protein [Roseomonas arctica]|uniref:Radical SAM protein n=2 Tax=Plastoroseomonas arctica TaxID=1509237 RepID=A0AAF1KKQ1_9PROT|nr:radical SAM protein [Plastoroseomonas arctica]